MSNIFDDGTYASGELYPMYGNVAGTQLPILAKTEKPYDGWRSPGWWGDYMGLNPNPSIWPQSDEGQAARHVPPTYERDNFTMPHLPEQTNYLPIALAGIAAAWYLKG